MADKTKAKAGSVEDNDLQDITIAIEEADTDGLIQINLNVITKIVQLAAREVPGVISVGGGAADLLAGIGLKREGGIRVEEDSSGNYIIRMNVVLEFGVDLAETASNIQTAVREQVKKMTSKSVARVDVNIDDVKPALVKSEDDDDLDHPMD